MGCATISMMDQSRESQLEALRWAGCERACTERKSGACDDGLELARVLGDVIPVGTRELTDQMRAAGVHL